VVRESVFALVICVNNMEDAFKILDIARKLSMDIPIFVRAHDDALIDNFLDANADEVISETREVGEMITTKLLLLFNKSPNEIYEHIKKTHGKRSHFLDIFINKDPDI